MPDGAMNVAVVGCGLIGKRRASVAAGHPRTRLTWAVDADVVTAAAVATQHLARHSSEWMDAIADAAVDIVCIATPNQLLAPIAIAAINAGKHVLLEKPMGRGLDEALAIGAAATLNPAVKVKVGFNHRYHPAIARARAEFDNGRIGPLINIRARYGHGGRPGYEREWRGSRDSAGGGELTDQGVHIADLIAWFAGRPQRAFAMLQTAVWPLGDLEDNAFATFKCKGGVVASFHTSWTQWKNLFSFEIFGIRGSLSVEGLGKSYGVERLLIADRAMSGGPPAMSEERFEGDDDSWLAEWKQFVAAIADGSSYFGNPRDGINAMMMLDALYRSAQSGAMEDL